MLEHIEHFLGSDIHVNLLMLIGLAMFSGTIGARIFQRLNIPQVIGYIITGLIVGELGFKLFSEHTIEQLKPINYFALGIIGFMIGGELNAEIFKKYGKQFIIMMIAEGLGAFLIVTPATALIVWFFTHNAILTIVLSLVIGSISSATDPASTMQVLWEYRTRGTLTTAIIAIVALDDALALLLYAVSTSIAGFFAGAEHANFITALQHISYELFGALILGSLAGITLQLTYKFIENPEKLLPYTIGLILFIIGVSQALFLDIILASMAFGVVFVNLMPRKSHETFDLVKKFAPPIYVLFFVFVGARLNISHMTKLVFVLIISYIIARSLGKMTGIYLGALISKASAKVRKYGGLCLFSQAGIAVGLSIMASQHFSKEIGDIIITVITATTFIVQIIGPAFVKLAVQKAGEVDLDVTEEDLISMYKVEDVMDKSPNTIPPTAILSEIIKKFSDSEDTVYYVTDSDHKLSGQVTFEGIRTALSSDFLSNMLIADDIMQSTPVSLTPETPLKEALHIMSSNNYEHLPVVEDKTSFIIKGGIILKKVKPLIYKELLKRKELSEVK